MKKADFHLGKDCLTDEEKKAVDKFKADCIELCNLKDMRIAELKADNDARKFAMAMSEKVETQLREENAELKDDNKVMADNYSKMEQKFYDNLTKAKEIIKYLLGFIKQEGYRTRWDINIVQAEQFIKNSEVEK